MSLRVSALKQENEVNINLDILFCSNSELLLRKLMNKAKIVILSIKSYEKDDNFFGKNYGTIDYNGQLVNLVTKFDDIVQSTEHLLNAGIKLVGIGSFDNIHSQDDLSKILQEGKQKIDGEKNIRVQTEISKQEIEKTIYENQKLKDIQVVIGKVLERIEETVQMVSGNVSGNMIKKLRDLENKLKKDRMGTNYDKIVMDIDQIFLVIDEIQEEFLSNIKEKESLISEDSVVSNFDIFRQYNTFYKSEIVKNLSQIHTKKDKYYVFLGKDGVFLHFFKKDIVKKFGNFLEIFYGFYNFLELLIAVLIAEMSLYIFFNEKLLFNPVDISAYNILINLGLFGVVVYFTKKFRKKDIKNLILLIFVILASYSVLYYFFRANFAL